MFCCVVVSILNYVEYSFAPHFFAHLWQTQLTAYLTDATAPFPFILAGRALILFDAPLSTKSCAQEMTPLAGAEVGSVNGDWSAQSWPSPSPGL